MRDTIAMSRKYLIAPFLYGLLPLASQLAFNLGAVPFRNTVRPTLIILLATAFALGLVIRWLGDKAFACAVVSIASVLFFIHGHLHSLGLAAIDQIGLAVTFSKFSQYLVMLTHGIIFFAETTIVIAVIKLFRREPRYLRVANQFLLGLAVAALCLPIIQIGAYTLRGMRLQANASTESTARELSPAAISATDSLPDIYYIVLDGYGRPDVLKEDYALDISGFLAALDDIGFQVSVASNSNYSSTLLSLTSSLNMAYIDDLSGPLQPGTPSAEVVQELVPKLKQGAVRKALEQRGYRTVAIATGFAWTEWWDADKHWQPSFQGIGGLESILIRTSVLGMLEDLASVMGAPYPYSGYHAHSRRILYALDQLPEVAQESGPKFVFVHMLVPHPPFVFTQDGDPYPERRAYGIEDANQYAGSVEDYLGGYREAVLFINGRIIPVLRSIIANSESPPVIVLQGDHGPGARLEWDHPTDRALRERMGILNAYFFPEGLEGTIPDSLSPVNSFRLVLNRVLDDNLELLPDRSFYSSPTDPYALTPVPPKGSNRCPFCAP